MIVAKVLSCSADIADRVAFFEHEGLHMANFLIHARTPGLIFLPVTLARRRGASTTRCNEPEPNIRENRPNTKCRRGERMIHDHDRDAQKTPDSLNNHSEE